VYHISSSTTFAILTLICSPGAPGANSEQDESVAPASPNPRLFAVDGQAMEPFAQYMQKLRQQCDPRTYQQVLDILSTLHFKPDSTDEVRLSVLAPSLCNLLITWLGGSLETDCKIVQGCTRFAC